MELTMQWFLLVGILTVSAEAFLDGGDGGQNDECLQLGCDQTGAFTQDGFQLPMNKNVSMVWTTKDTYFANNEENRNYGCVGNHDIIVCSVSKKGGAGRQVMLHTEDGEEYNFGVSTLYEASMPILTTDGYIVQASNEFMALFEPIHNKGFFMPLLQKPKYGILSPVYMPHADLFLVFGNFSETHTAYRIVEKDGEKAIAKIAEFTIPRTGSNCSWVPASEPAMRGNRLFFYAGHPDQTYGIVALDVSPTAPYVTKAWEYYDKDQLSFTSDKGDDCSIDPYNIPVFPNQPPTDVNTQLLATPDNYIVMTMPFGLIVFKDYGNYANQTGSNLFGSHFLALDTSSTLNPTVWMTGWPQSSNFRVFMYGFNYTSSDWSQGIWAINLQAALGTSDLGLNVTSRITVFADPASTSSKILLFGVRLYTATTDSLFHTKFCPQCAAGMNSMLLAVRRSAAYTEKPDILWAAQLPTPTCQVKGQVIGAGDTLVAYVEEDDGFGKVVAFK